MNAYAACIEDRALSEREQRVWDAAYAAAYVAEFNSSLARLQKYRGDAMEAHNEACRETSAERSCLVADLAVIQLRLWRFEGLSNDDGVFLPAKWPDEYGFEEQAKSYDDEKG